MGELQADKLREVITDFETRIEEAREEGPKPGTKIIDFRDNVANQKEDPVYSVPIQLLRFRLANGRVASNVQSHQKEKGALRERDQETQDFLRRWLQQKDPDATKALQDQIRHRGQQEPAIITCDGFLIDGNRRKLALMNLYDEEKAEKFSRMKVVILPRNVTQREIELIENRYQLQVDGKSEYTGLDKAISIRSKRDRGITIEQQLKDDATHSNKSPKEISKEEKTVYKDLLGPLELADMYLAYLGQPGVYDYISGETKGGQGVWDALSELYKNFYRHRKEGKKLFFSWGMSEEEADKALDIAFKLIAAGTLPGKDNARSQIRSVVKILKDSTARHHLMPIHEMEISDGRVAGSKGTKEEWLKTWAADNKTKLTKHLKKAESCLAYEEEQDAPIDALEGALSKLKKCASSLANYTPNGNEIKEAMDLLEEITGQSEHLHKEFDGMRHRRRGTLSEKIERAGIIGPRGGKKRRKGRADRPSQG